MNQITISFVSTQGPRVVTASIQIMHSVITALKLNVGSGDVLAETVPPG